MWLTKDGRRAGWDSSEVRDAFQDVLDAAGMGLMSLGDGAEPQYCTPHSIRASAVAWACRMGSVTAGPAMCIMQAMQAGRWAGVDSKFLSYFNCGCRHHSLQRARQDGDRWLLVKPWPASGMTFDPPAANQMSAMDLSVFYAGAK